MSESSSSVAGYYQQAYGGKTGLGARPPWDIGEPQTPFVKLSKSGAIRGEVLDIGCGSGEMALFLAGEGHSVTGVDLSEQAVEVARRRAVEQGSTARFAVGSALDLSAYAGAFDTVVDCGLFHALPKAEQSAYAAQLLVATRPGARAYLLEMSADARTVVKEKFAAVGVPDQVRAQFAPLFPDDLRNAFADGWTAESVEESAIRVRFPGDEEITALPAWLGVFQRP